MKGSKANTGRYQAGKGAQIATVLADAVTRNDYDELLLPVSQNQPTAVVSVQSVVLGVGRTGSSHPLPHLVPLLLRRRKKRQTERRCSGRGLSRRTTRTGLEQ